MRDKTSPEGPDRSPEEPEAAPETGVPPTGDVDREVGAEVEILPTAEAAREIDLDECDREIWAGIDIARRSADGMLEGLLEWAQGLAKARSAFPRNDEFGDWVEVQGYPGGISYANRIRQLAGHEDEAREFVKRAFDETGEFPSRTAVIKAVKSLRAASGTTSSGRGAGATKPRRPTMKTVTADELLREVEDFFDDVAAIVDENRDRKMRLSILAVITDAESGEVLLKTELGPSTPPDLKATTGGSGRDR
jgi:hypothetical protein